MNTSTILCALFVVTTACAPRVTSSDAADAASPPPSPADTAAAGATSTALDPRGAAEGEASDLPAAWSPNARVYLGSAPDDGTAYIIAIGPRTTQPDAFGGTCGIDREARGAHLSLGFKGMPRATAASMPSEVTFRMGTNQDVTEGWLCEGGSACVPFDGGVVQLERVEPNRLARGHYRLQRRDGGLEEGRFDAVWCGPPPDPSAPAFPPSR